MIPIRVKFALAASLLAGLCGPWLTVNPASAQTLTESSTPISIPDTLMSPAFIDTTAPTIVSTSPTDGQTNVSPGTPILFTFSEAIDPKTLSVLVYYINPDRTRTLIPGTVTYDSSTWVGTFSPTDPLSSGILHYVSASARDPAGNLGAKTWSFTTVSLVTTDTTTSTTDTSFKTTDKPTETTTTDSKTDSTTKTEGGSTGEETTFVRFSRPISDSTSEGTARTDVTVVEETVEESTESPTIPLDDGATEEPTASPADLALEIDADSNVAWVGEEVSVKIVVSNNGDSPADGVVVTADIAGDVSAATSALVSFITKPADCTGDPAITCHLESIGAGEKVVLNFTLSPDEAGLQVITFQVESSEEGNPSDNIDQMVLQVSAEEENDTEVVGETELAFSAFGGGGCQLATPETGESASFASLYLVLLASAFLFTLKIRKS